jgi:hypothetical protein
MSTAKKAGGVFSYEGDLSFISGKPKVASALPARR